MKVGDHVRITHWDKTGTVHQLDTAQLEYNGDPEPAALVELDTTPPWFYWLRLTRLEVIS